ncbi:type II toxin-antitoxin system PemK/MazF family toxin [bacterium]
MKIFPHRGDVYWVKLDPVIGTETKKTRPGLILSNNIGNEVSSRVIIAPITSKIKNVYPFETSITINKKSNKVMLDQIRVIDKQRLDNFIDAISDKEMVDVEKSLRLVLDL